MNKLVSLPIAKLLKEKGFDIPCREGWVNYLESFTGETRMPDDESNLVMDRLGNSHLIERPTIADVVMWFYEKHKIWISVNATEELKSFWYEIRGVGKIWFTGKNCESPEESYEAAIEYALNHII